VPPTLADRWFSDVLLEAQDAPEAVACVMAHRTELLFKLLIDRQRWLAHGDDD